MIRGYVRVGMVFQLWARGIVLYPLSAWSLEVDFPEQEGMILDEVAFLGLGQFLGRDLAESCQLPIVATVVIMSG